MARDVAKDPREMEFIRQADLQGDGPERRRRPDHESFGRLDADLAEIAHGRQAGALVKEARKMRGALVSYFCQSLQGYFLGEILMDVTGYPADRIVRGKGGAAGELVKSAMEEGRKGGAIGRVKFMEPLQKLADAATPIA
jgi:hypothetical protein